LLNRRQFLLSTVATAALPQSLPAEQASSKVVRLATYAHIDAAWRWPLQEGLQQSDATFRSVLRVLNAFPTLKFSETSASYYAWIRRTDPQTYARIVAMTKARRWEPIGGWWTEADVNIISGESLMRQGFAGLREFHDHLGVTTKVAFLPDSFGSSANLPAILWAQGFDYYVLGRGAFADGPPPAGAFTWRSLGDASVVAYNNPVSGGTNDAVAIVTAAAKLPEDVLVWFGLGDHGGGPTIDALNTLDRFLQTANAPKVVFSLVEQYLRTAPTNGVVRDGELQGVFPGAYTNCYDIKRANVDAERALIDCERYDLLASLCGAQLPRPSLDALWETLLLNQHHDTISATGLRENVDAAVAQNRAVADRATLEAAPYLDAIVDRIAHDPQDDAMLVAFNPLPHATNALISYPLSVPPGKVPRIFDSAGNAVAAQIALSESVIYLHQSPPTCFVAALPAFGYAAYRIRGTDDLAAAPPPSPPPAIDNGLLTVGLDARSGLPAFLQDSLGKVELGRARFAVFDDHADTWGGDTLATSPELGSFDLTDVRVLEQGPVRTVIEGTYAFRSSRLRVRTELRSGDRAIRFGVASDWNEPFARYGLAFEFAGGVAVYDIPYGIIQRPAANAIAPGISFVARGRDPHGLVGLVSCGNHGFWGSPTTLGVTLSRSTPYSSLDDVDPAATSFMDTGRRNINVMIALAQDVPDLRAIADGFERNFPVVWNGTHDGHAPPTASFAAVPAGVTLTSARRTGDGTQLRLHNLGGNRQRASGHVGSLPFDVPLDPFGIRTLQQRGMRFEDITRQ
jgi:alpha-mannosidase